MSDQSLAKRRVSREQTKLKNGGSIYTAETRKRFSIGKTGKLNPAWKGGRWKNKAGYVWTKAPLDHPFKDDQGYILEHRLVMEKKLGRYLLTHEHVHHRNAIKDDNRPENLEIVFTRPHHGEVKCPHCNNIFLIR